VRFQLTLVFSPSLSDGFALIKPFVRFQFNISQFLSKKKSSQHLQKACPAESFGILPPPPSLKILLQFE